LRTFVKTRDYADFMFNTLNESRFQRLWSRLGGGDALVLFAELSTAYAEPQRGYHNCGHIVDCLSQLDSVRHFIIDVDAVETAIWFHDAVYDPHRHDNESRSAAWALAAMSADSIDDALRQRIAALILDTTHDRVPASDDGRVLVDIDLSILGREPEVFAAYEAGIRQEYHFAPEAEYRIGRAAVLSRFLARSRIFNTDHFHARFEQAARLNLNRSLLELSQN
jgi:predicted metal-dependent HD superfamily phosphohydrolase